MHPPVQDHLRLLREYGDLERKRVSKGVTPLEYQRWLDLDQRLGSQFRKARAERSGPPRTTRMSIDFRTVDQFCEAYIHELSRGGLFVNTPFAPEIGTELVMLVRIHARGETLPLPGVVATNNVSDGFSTDLLGMGIHFGKLEPEVRLKIDDLFAQARHPAKRR